MSACIKDIYKIPNPTRTWYRVQNECTYNTTTPNINYDMINKANVLQYKQNSSNFTKKQIYSLISKNLWINRNHTNATQSETYTNPNIKQLQRNNYTLIKNDGTSIDPSLPITLCKKTIINEIPSLFSKPPINNNYEIPNVLITNFTLPYYKNENIDEIQYTIQNGGTLNCRVTQNICTGEIYSVKKKINCVSNTYSNVPGKPIQLCYDSKYSNWNPRQRRIMGVSGDKFPQGYKFSM